MCWKFFNALPINQIYLNLLLACAFVFLLSASHSAERVETRLHFFHLPPVPFYFFLNWLIASKQ